MFRVRLTDGAREEYLEALEWYALNRPEALAGFGADFEAGHAKLAAQADAFAMTEVAGIRSLALAAFPYSLIYRIEDREVVVGAVAHHRRRPGYWRRRF